MDLVDLLQHLLAQDPTSRHQSCGCFLTASIGPRVIRPVALAVASHRAMVSEETEAKHWWIIDIIVGY